MIGRPFQKGTSGNPGGRRPMQPDIREALAAETLNAVRTIVKLRDDDGQPGSVRLAAATALLDRYYGRPGLSVAISDEGSAEAQAARDESFRQVLAKAAAAAHAAHG